MSKSIEIQVLDKIKRSPRGTLLFVDSFTKIANTKSANKLLERLVQSGEIERIGQGIYVRPVIDNYIGKVLPSIEQIAFAIAKRDRATLMPTGSYAMYILGLTMQDPLNTMILTKKERKHYRLLAKKRFKCLNEALYFDF